MAAHDGRLVLESSTDRVTVFALRIPVAQTEEEPTRLRESNMPEKPVQNGVAGAGA